MEQTLEKKEEQVEPIVTGIEPETQEQKAKRLSSDPEKRKLMNRLLKVQLQFSKRQTRNLSRLNNLLNRVNSLRAQLELPPLKLEDRFQV